MGMYCGLMLTPTAPGIVPGANPVIELFNWLISTGDLIPPTPEMPLKVEIGLDPKGILDPEEEIEVFNISNDLEPLLAKSSSWGIYLSTNENLVEAENAPEDSVLNTLELTEPRENGRSCSLSSISFDCITTQSFAWWSDEEGSPDRSFSIILCSDLKMTDEGGLENNYPEVAWEKLVAAGKIEQMQNILGFTLEAWPYIC